MKVDKRKKLRVAKMKLAPQLESGDAREALLDAAEVVFAKKGYAAATVKDLATEAGVNVGLVSYYFSGKEGLYRACLERFGNERMQLSKTILQVPESLEEFKVRLKLWVQQLIEVNLRQKNIIPIMQRGIYGQDPIVREVLESKFRASIKTLEDFFSQAKDKKMIRSDLDIDVVTSLFFGGIIHLMHRKYFEHLFLGKSEIKEASFQKIGEQALHLLFEGILVR